MAAIRDKAKKFHKFVRGLQEKYAVAIPDPALPLMDRFVFYLLFYSNPSNNARKALKTFQNDELYASWSEIRVSTVREIADVLADARVRPADFLAPRLKEFLQLVFQEADETGLEALLAPIKEAEDAKTRKAATETAKSFIQNLPGLPPWGPSYILTGLGLETAVPWDPHTEAVMESLKVFPAKSTLTQKRRVLKALVEGLDDLGPLGVHHLLVEYGKRELNRRR